MTVEEALAGYESTEGAVFDIDDVAKGFEVLAKEIRRLRSTQKEPVLVGPTELRFLWSSGASHHIAIGTPYNVAEVVDALFQAASILDRDQSLRG